MRWLQRVESEVRSLSLLGRGRSLKSLKRVHKIDRGNEKKACLYLYGAHRPERAGLLSRIATARGDTMCIVHLHAAIRNLLDPGGLANRSDTHIGTNRVSRTHI